MNTVREQNIHFQMRTYKNACTLSETTTPLEEKGRIEGKLEEANKNNKKTRKKKVFPSLPGHQYLLPPPPQRISTRVTWRIQVKDEILANSPRLVDGDQSLRASSIPLLLLLVLVPWKHGRELVLKASRYIELERLSIVGEAPLDGPQGELAESVDGQRDVHAGPLVPLGQLASPEVAIPGEPRLREEHVPLVHRVPGRNRAASILVSFAYSPSERTNRGGGREISIDPIHAKYTYFSPSLTTPQFLLNE